MWHKFSNFINTVLTVFVQRLAIAKRIPVINVRFGTVMTVLGLTLIVTLSQSGAIKSFMIDQPNIAKLIYALIVSVPFSLVAVTNLLICAMDDKVSGAIQKTEHLLALVIVYPVAVVVVILTSIPIRSNASSRVNPFKE